MGVGMSGREAEDAAARAYRSRCIEIEEREDALRMQEYRFGEAVDELLYRLGQSGRLVDEMRGAMPCMVRQASYALDELNAAQHETALRCDERRDEFAREKGALERQHDQAREAYHRSLETPGHRW